MLKDNMCIASVPCGLMDDLLRLDYNSTNNISIYGIDLDQNSLDLSYQNAKKLGFSNVTFLNRNAWDLGIHNKFDVITSNGLNIYEADDQRVILLYKEFYKALVSGGVLITSFLTPPPTLDQESPWKDVNGEDLKKQKIIFSDILGVRWQAFRNETQTCNQLEQAGFDVMDIIYDKQGLFPTIMAKRI